MRHTMFLAVLMIILLSASRSFSKEPVEFVEDFFGMLQEGRIAEAYDNLLVGSGIPEIKPQAVSKLKSQTSSGLPLYGKVLGFEKVQEEKFGTSIARLVYVLKFEKAPTIWEFYFYNPKSTWFFGTVSFNDQYENLNSKE